MNALNFQIKDESGINRFISPIITGVKGKVNHLITSESGSLQYGYAILAMSEGVDSWSDKTKREAGTLILPALQGIPADVVLTLYMPTKYEDRNNTDLKKWTPVVKTTAGALTKVAQGLASIDSLMRETLVKVEEVAKSHLMPIEAVNPQPVYFEGSTLRNKTGGGKKVLALPKFE